MLNYISMTPKEKAIELCNKFMIHNSYQSIVWYNAKQCALIAADEILSIKKEIWDDFHSEYFKYWQEVKQEIELL